jgi:hypothetical protein
MSSSRSSFFALGGIALLSGVLALGATTLAPTGALACPESDAEACPCGEACASDHAAGCTGDHAAAGCADKADKGAACACPQGADGNCACGAECGSKHGGDCKAAGDADKKPGACGCGGAGAAATEPGEEKAGGCGAAEGAAQQRAVIDPATGQLVVPDKADAAAAADSEPVAAGMEGSAKAGAATAKQLAVPGAGVMAPFPNARASKAVATVDDAGEPHAGCQHDAE